MYKAVVPPVECNENINPAGPGFRPSSVTLCWVWSPRLAVDSDFPALDSAA